MHHTILAPLTNCHVRCFHTQLRDVLQANTETTTTTSDVLTFIDYGKIFQYFAATNTVKQIVQPIMHHTVDFQYNYFAFGNHSTLWFARADKTEQAINLPYTSTNVVLVRRLPNQKLAILVGLNDAHFLHVQIEQDGTWKEMCKIHTHHSCFNHISVSPDCSLVCGTTSGSHAVLLKFDMSTGTYKFLMEFAQGGSYCSSINIDNTLLFAIDPYRCRSFLYRIADSSVVWMQDLATYFYTVGKFSPVHPDLLAYCTKTSVILHDVRLDTKWEVERTTDQDECAMSFSADGSKLYVTIANAVMVIAIDSTYCKKHKWQHLLLKNALQYCYTDVQVTFK